MPTFLARRINTNYQFAAVVEIVEALMKSIENQSCEICCNEVGDQFMAMCSKCHEKVATERKNV